MDGFSRTPHPTSISKFRLVAHDFGASSLISIDLCSRFNYNGFLGLDFLREYSLFIDYPNKRIFLDLQPTLPSILWSKPNLGYNHCP